MSHNADYSRLYVGDGYGLSLDEIGNCVGSGSRDLGTLCRHDNINMLSYHKPTAYTGFDSGTWAQVFFNDSSSPDADACSIEKVIKSVLYSVYNNTTDVGTIKVISSEPGIFPNEYPWKYIKPPYPDGRYRLLDFNGYVRANTFTYEKTSTWLPYETCLNPWASSDTSNKSLNVPMMLRFATADTPYLLGIQQLINEGTTTLVSLDFRLGFIIRAEASEDRANALYMMYISEDNLADYIGSGYYHKLITKSNAIADGPTSFPSDAFNRSRETIQAYPFIAKKAESNWILYGFGIGSYPTVQKTLGTTGLDMGLYSCQIKLTLDKESDGTFVFYIDNSSDFQMRTDYQSDAGVLFGKTPIALGVSYSGNTGYIVTRKPGVITFGTQNANSGYWNLSVAGGTMLTATNIIGWNSTDTPFNRVGSLAVQPKDGATSFNINVFANSCTQSWKGTATVNPSTAQDGDTFTITLTGETTTPDD